MSSKDSNYSRKSDWTSRNGVWGFEVPEPKPWKKGSKTGVTQHNRPCSYAADVAAKIEEIARRCR
jgi:hypothetical protein